MKYRVVVLSKHNPSAYENRRLRRALEAYGIHAECCDPSLFSINVGAQPVLTYRGNPFPTPHLVLVRTGSGTGTHTVTILRAMMAMGIIVVNPIEAIQAAMDKAATIQLAHSIGLPIPKTLIFGGRQDVISAWTGGYPCIVKLSTGSHGVGTFKCESPTQLKALVQMITALDPKRLYLIQEYLGTRPGVDLRCLVVGQRALSVAMLRSSTSDDFRAGITGGGIGSPFKVTPQIAEISESIVRLMRLEAVAGVDLLWQGENVVICEVNSAPGFRGFETYCGIDVAARIAAHVHSLLVNIPTSVIQ